MAKIKISSILLFLPLLIACTIQPTHEEILQLNLKDHNEMALHIHPKIEIEILGEKQTIPENIGITEKGMHAIHTHESDGKLHLESPYPTQFYLKDFFTIWGKTFNKNQIFFYTTDDKHTLKVYLNGKEDNRFSDIPLKDDDVIKIVYK